MALKYVNLLVISTRLIILAGLTLKLFSIGIEFPDLQISSIIKFEIVIYPFVPGTMGKVAEMLKQESFRFLSQDKDVDYFVKEYELRDTKQEILKLGSLVRLIEIQEIHVHVEKSKV